MAIIDCAEDASEQIIHLQADDITAVGRYLTSAPGSSKLVTPREARALAAAGIRLWLVFENGGGSPGYNDITAAHGMWDGAFAVKYAPTVGAPLDGSACIYFAIDNDMSSEQIAGLVIPYFTSIKSEFAGSHLLAGVYGSGAVCEAVCSRELASYAWLSGSTGWTGSREYLASRPQELVLVQKIEDTRLANLDVDTDESFAEFGDFLPFAGATS